MRKLDLVGTHKVQQLQMQHLPLHKVFRTKFLSYSMTHTCSCKMIMISAMSPTLYHWSFNTFYETFLISPVVAPVWIPTVGDCLQCSYNHVYTGLPTHKSLFLKVQCLPTHLPFCCEFPLALHFVKESEYNV